MSSPSELETGRSEESDENATIPCTYCYFKERVNDFSELRPGHHIVQAGTKFAINLQETLYSLYDHHAIVKSCQKLSNGNAIVTLIHFIATPYDKTISLRETSEYYDLFYHEIYIIKYRHFTNSPAEILRRAEDFVSGKEEQSTLHYSLFGTNCEHFCHLCCVGQKKSKQVGNLFAFLKNLIISLGSSIGKVAKVICKLFIYSVSNIYRISKYVLKFFPCVVLCAILILGLAYALWRHYKLREAHKKGEICSICRRRLQQDNWIRLSLTLIFQIGGFSLITVLLAIISSKGIVIGLVGIIGMLIIAVISLTPKLRRRYFSPFHGRLIPVEKAEQIKSGDVVSVNHCELTTIGVVSSVQIQDSTSAKISVIHYSSPKLFSARTIAETKIEVDVKKKNAIFCYDYKGDESHPPETVVERAKMRLGEQKFRLFFNRSCHFAHWAKIKTSNCFGDYDICNNNCLAYKRSVRYTESCNKLKHFNNKHSRKRKQASKCLALQWIKTRNEITEGQIVLLQNGIFWNKAISTKVAYDEEFQSKLSLTVVHCKTNTICEETIPFDLRFEDIWVYVVHPVNSFRKPDIVQRARARIGEKNSRMFGNRSSSFAKEVAIKENYDELEDFDTLKLGDAIRFKYWSLLHDGIVVGVENLSSKANNIGRITIIHYALDTLFGTRTVKEDTFEINLLYDTVYVLNFKGFVTYPPKIVVQRAMQRIGEQRFNPFENTSSDLVHWSTVVQTPAIVTIGLTDKQVLLPEVGKAYKNFQIVEAQAWCDLKVGEIVEYRYYLIPHQGILSNIDSEKEEIKVIHYGTQHLFATRTIMEDTLALNLKTHTLRIYRADPAKRNTLKKALELAKERIGEQSWTFRNRSWHFCLSCVLKPEAKGT